MHNLKILAKNLIVAGQLLISMAFFFGLAYFSTIGMAYQFKGHEFIERRGTGEGANWIFVILGINMILSFFFWYHHAAILVLVKQQSVRMIRLDGFEKYEIKYLRWYSNLVRTFADQLENKARN
jgi:hypothetical protein